jgi:DMSO/TMAO reductase YedYZ molybdopterin-dependent catalytic subunit
MSNLSRRKLITTGLAATVGASGLAVATSLARRYGLIPPDGAGIYGPGETLTYAAQRILTRHSSAREFPRSHISKTPFANEVAPLGEAFKSLQEAGFADWRLAVDGMVARPASFSLAELKSYPFGSQITHLACEEGWSYIAEWIGVPLPHVLDPCGDSAPSPICCLPFHSARLVGKHRHGRCIAPSNSRHLRHEWA